jgi:hypothetical protein
MALPILALAAPIIGGAMSLAGGAMSLTGGVLSAASTVAGIAADAAGGVIGAVGGLLGGGKSGNVREVESEASEGPKTPMGTYRDKKGVLRNDGTMNQKGSFASDPSKGMSLAKVKSSIDPLNAEGGVSMLPTGKESQVTLLSQILGQIRTNTGALFSIDGKIGGLIDAFSTPPPSDPKNLIDEAQQKKGGVMSRIGAGVTSTFSALGKRLKGLASNLGGAAKFALKGLLLTGALVLFRKYRENIVGFVARTFEKLSDFVATFDKKDPIGSFFDKLMSTGEGSILNSLKSGIGFVIEELINGIKLMINEMDIPFVDKFLIPSSIKVDTSGDDVLSSSGLSETAQASASKSKVFGVGVDKKTFKATAIDTGLDENNNKILQDSLTNRILSMHNAYIQSSGRVQWGGVGKGFFGTDPNSILRMNPGITANDILTSEPYFDGKKITIEQLNAGLDYTAGFEGLDKDTIEKITKNLALKSDYRQMVDMGQMNTGFLNTTPVLDKVIGVETQNRELGFNVNKSDAANSVNVINASSNDNSIKKSGDTIQVATTAHPREGTAIAEFKAAYQ